MQPRWPLIWIVALIALVVGCAPQVSAPAATANPNQSPIPLLAYYYIWFDRGSWDRAKIDYPLLGRYSSNDQNVMRQHVKWAKAAGVDGFIVSWKSTDTLNQRLTQLIDIANREQFKLAIIYEGLDFDRNPLPVERVAADLDYFASQYASNSAFDLFGKPLVIWSGSWEFSRDDIAKVTSTRRARLLVLASERNLEGYDRLADVVDGNAYYWSSVNPDTFPGYQEKLNSLSKVVHAQHGLWIAPAAPGFDARLIGGKTVVERKDGDTLQRELSSALQSSPDAIGLISWNEFSENTHIEPSQKNGMRYLNALANTQGAPVPDIGNFDSSEPGSKRLAFNGAQFAALGMLLVLIAGSVIVIAHRQRAASPQTRR
jgi:glycosyl hydrolase family 99